MAHTYTRTRENREEAKPPRQSAEQRRLTGRVCLFAARRFPSAFAHAFVRTRAVVAGAPRICSKFPSTRGQAGARAKAGTRRGRGELQADCKQEERLLHFTSPLIPAPLPPSHTFPTRLATEDVYDVARGRGRKCGGTQQPRGAQRKCAFVFLFFLLFVAVLTCRAGAAVSPRRPSSAPPTRRPSRGPLRVARAAASARAPPPPCRRHRWKPLRPPTASTVASCRRRPLVRATRSCCVLCRWAIWSMAAPDGVWLRRVASSDEEHCGTNAAASRAFLEGKGVPRLAACAAAAPRATACAQRAPSLRGNRGVNSLWESRGGALPLASAAAGRKSARLAGWPTVACAKRVFFGWLGESAGMLSSGRRSHTGSGVGVLATGNGRLG